MATLRRIDGSIIAEDDTKTINALVQENYADLMDANLRYADLRGADLRDANLMDANLMDADLRDANLMDANLRYANLRGANLGDGPLKYPHWQLWWHRWELTILDRHVRIGCEEYEIAEILEMTNHRAQLLCAEHDDTDQSNSLPALQMILQARLLEFPLEEVSP